MVSLVSQMDKLNSVIYENPRSIAKEAAEAILLKGNSSEMCSALISIALYEKDLSWAQDLVFPNFLSTNKDIAQAAITSVGHLARLHGQIDLDRLNFLLERMIYKAELSGNIEDMFNDIEVFCK